MASQNEGNSFNAYAHCPTMPIHTPIEGPLNCNIDYDVEKQYDNFVFPATMVYGKRMEHFNTPSCFDFLVKLVIFVAIMWFIIYLLLKK